MCVCSVEQEERRGGHRSKYTAEEPGNVSLKMTWTAGSFAKLTRRAADSRDRVMQGKFMLATLRRGVHVHCLLAPGRRYRTSAAQDRHRQPVMFKYSCSHRRAVDSRWEFCAWRLHRSDEPAGVWYGRIAGSGTNLRLHRFRLSLPSALSSSNRPRPRPRPRGQRQAGAQRNLVPFRAASASSPAINHEFPRPSGSTEAHEGTLVRSR